MSALPSAKLKRAQLKFDAARAERDRALREGREAGLSLRTLAELTGLGVETVRRIVGGVSS